MKNISVIGGDLRIVELIRLLNKEYEIITYGFENFEKLEDCKKVENFIECFNNSDIIISGIPLSKDGKTLNMPYSSKKIELEDFFQNLQNKKLIAGKVPKDYAYLSKNLEIIDLMECEELAIMNAIPTAEGAIQIAMEETKYTIHNSNVLILGFGRIGKILAKMLKGIGANVYCEARKDSDIAWIKAYGYNPIYIDELKKCLSKFDIIFNNIPTIILNKEELALINPEALIIDLASKPGGVNFQIAKQKGIKAIWALALPGKVAPSTAAKYIEEIIRSYL